jgi:hypothetical protein
MYLTEWRGMKKEINARNYSKYVAMITYVYLKNQHVYMKEEGISDIRNAGAPYTVRSTVEETGKGACSQNICRGSLV